MQSWLASVLFGGWRSSVGWPALRLLLVRSSAPRSSAAGSSRPRPAPGPPRRRLTPVLFVAAEGWDQRPYLFAFAGLVLALLRCEGSMDPRWLLPAGWLWVNIHGSWPLGLLAVGALWAGARLDGGDAERRAARRASGSAAGWRVGVLNPYGLRLLTFPLRRCLAARCSRGSSSGRRRRSHRHDCAFLLVLVLAIARPSAAAVVAGHDPARGLRAAGASRAPATSTSPPWSSCPASPRR